MMMMTMMEKHIHILFIDACNDSYLPLLCSLYSANGEKYLSRLAFPASYAFAGSWHFSCGLL